MRSAFIALGTNMPFNDVSGAALLTQAAAAIEEAGLPILKRSSVWQTEAWPPESAQPDYFNAIVAVDPGTFDPQQLYAALRAIEARFGRERRERWGPRTLDLDIIAMGDLAGTFAEVRLPHPRLHERPFVLVPLAQIAPEWRHPVLGRKADEFLAELPSGYRMKPAGALN